VVRAVVDCGLSKAEVARRYNITPKTVAKWVERFRDEGIEGRRDRSSRPRQNKPRLPHAQPLRLYDGSGHRRADRQAACHLAGDGEPHPSSAGSQSAQRA
jgi:transposase-like protein